MQANIQLAEKLAKATFEETFRDTSLVSDCCFAAPRGEVSDDLCGICSRCNDHATFSPKD